MKRRKRKSTEKFPFALNWQALISIKICFLMNSTSFSFIPIFPGEAFIFTTQFSIKQSLLSHITQTTSIIQYPCVCIYKNSNKILLFFIFFYVFLSWYLSSFSHPLLSTLSLFWVYVMKMNALSLSLPCI